MNLRITDDGNECDIQEIHALLKAYNLNRREPSQDVPLGFYLEDGAGGSLPD